ncbi:MAG: hypothetical protein EXX96DRAFT_548550 [Benjaminiella poitrasii]|nr:MAG: hypothetical protein EXX96DRAFT_548550 [Benjaminiella poitrasii]
MLINELPSEILLQILQRIIEPATSHSKKDILECALTCRIWSYYSLQLLWNKPLLLKPQNWLKFSKTISQQATYLPYASFVRCVNLSAITEYVSDESLQTLSLCRYLDRVAFMGCSYVTNQGFIHFLNQNVGQHLLSIDLSEIKHLTDEVISVIAQSCQQLKGLNLSIADRDEELLGITDKSIVELAEGCRHLKWIRLSNWRLITDESIFALAKHCPNLLEIDVINCAITNESLWKIFSICRHLRGLKINHCRNLDDRGFLQSALTMTPPISFEQLRVLEMTNLDISDATLDCITLAAPKIRNLVLNKCVQLTDRAVEYIGRLGRSLHFLHLGYCKNITDASIVHLAEHCTRLRYIDLACCQKLGDDSVIALATLPKLKRIGLVRCRRITNRSILALTQTARTVYTLERLHFSYCDQLTVQAISILVLHCRRLTHLSLSYIPAFQQSQSIRRFCQPAPKEYTAEQQRTFCVFSGPKIHELRGYFKSSEYLNEREMHHARYYYHYHHHSHRIEETQQEHA